MVMASSFSSRKAKVWLFYLKCFLRVRGKLSFNAIREICSYFPATVFGLAFVAEAFMRVFNCQDCTWGQKIHLRTKIEVDIESKWVMLDDGRLFCCGGGGNCQEVYQGRKSAYLISRIGAVNRLPDMLFGRQGLLSLLKTHMESSKS